MTTTSDYQLEKDEEDIDNGLLLENPKILSSNKNNESTERNIIEEKKVKIISNTTSFKFNLNIYGKSLFEDLFLLITTNTNANTEIVYRWKRIKDNTTIPLKDINTRMYILSAEDLGYIIDVEVMQKQSPNEIAHAQYGPIGFNKGMKDIMSLFLSKASSRFRVSSYSKAEKPKNNLDTQDKIIYANPNEFILKDIDNYNTQENEVERSKYIPFNTSITLNQFDPLKFAITFNTYEYEDTQSSTIRLISQREYYLIAPSKQIREVIYLLFKFRALEEELKNNKLFSFINFNAIPSEKQDSMIDLIEELSLIKEENKLMIGNIKYLEYINNKVTKSLKRLEEDYQITLETINAIDCYHLNNESTDNDDSYALKLKKKNSQNEIKGEVLGHSIALKAKCDNLLEENKALIEKDKQSNEEISQHIIKEEQYINIINKKELEIEHIRDKYSELKNDNDEMNKENNKLLNELKRIANEKDALKGCNSSKVDLSKNEVDTLQNKLSEVLKAKAIIETEYNQLKQEKETIESDYNNLHEQFNALKLSIEAKEFIINRLSSELTDVKDENDSLKSEINKLKESVNTSHFNHDEKEKSLKSQMNELINDKKELEKQIDELEIQAKSTANDNRLIRLSFQTKEEEMKEIASKLNIALEENKARALQYDAMYKDNMQLQDLYGKQKNNNTKQDLNYSQDSFMDIKQREMFEELIQLKKEKDETDAYILKLKYNNDKHLSDIEQLKKAISKHHHKK